MNKENIEEKNAKIVSTILGRVSGVFRAYLCLDYGDANQEFGGFPLDKYDEATKKRVSTACGIEFIIRVLKTVGVGKWENLPGNYIRVKADDNHVYAIGHIIEDRWFCPQEDLKFLQEEDK